VERAKPWYGHTHTHAIVFAVTRPTTLSEFERWQVYATGSETFFGRTALLINAVNDPGNFEKRLRQITLVITCSGVVLVVITFLYLVANQQPVCSHCC